MPVVRPGIRAPAHGWTRSNLLSTIVPTLDGYRAAPLGAHRVIGRKSDCLSDQECPSGNARVGHRAGKVIAAAGGRVKSFDAPAGFICVPRSSAKRCGRLGLRKLEAEFSPMRHCSRERAEVRTRAAEGHSCLTAQSQAGARGARYRSSSSRMSRRNGRAG